jgi:hypothetical protein
MKKAFVTLSFLFIASSSFAQVSSGNLASGLSSAASGLTQLVAPIRTFLYVLAGIIGIYGAIRVYSKHQNGDQDTNKAMGQFGFAFVFLIAAGLVLSAMFGI